MSDIEVHDGRRSDLAELVEPPRKDGFRKPKKRPKGWLEKAIKDGSVRDPNAPPEAEPVYGENVHVITVPMAEQSSDGTKE
jgi:hypothetical protein